MAKLVQPEVLSINVSIAGALKLVRKDEKQYYIRNQQEATLAVSFISHCKITLHVSDAFCVHHKEY